MIPTAATLTQALHAAGLLPDGEVVAIEEGQQFEACATSVVRCHLHYRPLHPPSLPKTMICKFYGPEWYQQGGIPDLMFFRRIAPALKSPIAPAIYGIIDDPSAQSCMLLIEDLAPGYHQVQLPLTDAWLEAIVDALADLHAQWWDAPQLNSEELLKPEDTVMRMAQALPLDGLRVNVEAARQAVSHFRSQFGPELTVEERELLALLVDRWAAPFIERTARHRGLTLLHGDFHLLGNIFIAKESPTVHPIKVIDWGQAKRGLGPHDLMYALLSVEVPDRQCRDLKLLRRYHQRLLGLGVHGYAWEQCLWDYRFSLLTNVFQSVFQGSLHWFRRTCDVVESWKARELLEPPTERASPEGVRP
jgi:hypothetical protein